MPKLFLILSLFSWASAEAEINKCVDADGTIQYQRGPCAPDTQASKVKIRKHPEVDFDMADSAIEAEPNIPPMMSEAEYKKQMKDLKKQSQKTRCAPHLKKYAQLKSQVKKRCRQDKDIYCDLPAVQIEQRNFKRDQAFSYRDGPNARKFGMNYTHHRSMTGRIKKPPLLVLKDELQQMKCL